MSVLDNVIIWGLAFSQVLVDSWPTNLWARKENRNFQTLSNKYNIVSVAVSIHLPMEQDDANCLYVQMALC